MMERVLGPGLRVLFGIIGVAALIAGIIVAATEVRLLFVGSPPIPTLLAAVVAGVAALGGGLVLRGAARGRIAVRSPRGRRHTISDRTP